LVWSLIIIHSSLSSFICLSSSVYIWLVIHFIHYCLLVIHYNFVWFVRPSGLSHRHWVIGSRLAGHWVIVWVIGLGWASSSVCLVIRPSLAQLSGSSGSGYSIVCLGWSSISASLVLCLAWAWVSPLSVWPGSGLSGSLVRHHRQLGLGHWAGSSVWSGSMPGSGWAHQLGPAWPPSPSSGLSGLGWATGFLQ